MKKQLESKVLRMAGAFILVNLAMIGSASAHCDSMDGPVIGAARSAIERRDVTPVLRWVPKNSERTIEAAFARTLAEGSRGKEFQDKADRKFFEKLVKVHRESEGEPFTGIKPAGHIEPIVAAADKALAEKDIDHLATDLSAELEKSIRAKFEAAAHSSEYADQSVERGREYVGNYVRYVHFVEELKNMAEAGVADGVSSKHSH